MGAFLLSALQSLPPNHPMKTTFLHKNIRLPLDRYVGTGWFFVTFCCEGRKRIFLESTRAQWFLGNLRSDALSHALAIHAYCVMPDHVHLLSQGLTPTSDLLRFLTDLKRQTGFAYKQGTRQQLWQKKSYDHALRSSDPPDLVAWYIWRNPIRAGLCTGVNDYP
jgi:REP-associated tyrosine transposase